MASNSARRFAARAFTLIELMVVILIIAVVIAILIPAVGGARTAAKRSATQNLMSNINSAVGVFENDEHRLPGYFLERDMGSAENASTYGMSSMENVMLDLIGMPPVGSPTAPGITIGPTATTQLGFAFDLFGVKGSEGTKQYFTPDPKFYIAQIGGPQGPQQVQVNTSSGHARAEGDQNQLKDVVDAWGMPLLAWRADETAVQPVTGLNDFARLDSSGGQARFYWASNACFLKATAAGRGFDQTLSATEMAITGTKKGSMIGADSGAAPQQALKSMMSLLGSPSYFVQANPPQFPSAPRGKFVLQSAGADGYYLGSKDRGRKQFSDDYVPYQLNFVTSTGGTLPANAQKDKDGNPTTVDVIGFFDDLVAAAGN